MEDGEEQSLEQIRDWVEASAEVRFRSQDRRELYAWVNRTLRQQDYGLLKRGGKGLVRRYIAKMTGLSRAQAARLIRCYQGGAFSRSDDILKSQPHPARGAVSPRPPPYVNARP